MKKLLLLLSLTLFTVSIPAQTPTPAPKAAPVAGEVSKINQAENKISLQTTDGVIDVVISPATTFKRVPPENPSITAAVASSLSEIGEKDKILVTGAVSADKKTIAAKNVYLMSKSDISKKLAAEQQAWRTRGISGRVVKVDFKTKEVTIATRTMLAETNVVITPKDTAEFMRYSPDSPKFADAVASNLAEIKPGDQLRALGDKSTDGLTFKAEKFVTGSFKTVAGKITAIDPAKNEITVEDVSNKKPVVIVLNKDSVVKRFPAEMAQNLARAMSGGFGGMQPPGGGQGGGQQIVVRQGGGEGRPQGGQPTQGGQPNTPGGQPTQGGGNRNPQGGGQGGEGGPRPMRMGGGSGSLDEMVAGLPSLTIADLKVGETIGISGSAGQSANRYIAFKLLSGVEPFLSIPRTAGRNGNQPSIDIPGLDGGFGNP